MSNQQPASTHRSLNGVVTKLVGDGATYGFINDEIFFPQTNVSGGPASVGDQVFAECEFSAHLPIKWNATSVKILQRSSDQRRQPPGNIVPEQQNLEQSSPVAITYQQHRQQRQQRLLDTNKQPDLSKQQFQANDQPGRLLDPNTHAGDFYNQNDPSIPFATQQQQQPQQQQDASLPIFQDTPMGPPLGLSYTSQPGSAFVQNQFVPPPFISQSAPMLPHTQSQQHLLPNNQLQNQGNQRHNQQSKGGMLARGNNSNNNYNNSSNSNQNDKNERNNRRNLNQRNDNKFDHPRGGDRDGGSQHNRSSRSRNSRDRSVGRANKRDDIPSRPSPPSHSSARSSTSVSSDQASKRKHYEVQNIPRAQILTNMNAYNMKQRCPSSVHVPSDLKDIIVNGYFRLDLKNIPKPLKFTIEKATAVTEQVNASETKELKPDSEEISVDHQSNAESVEQVNQSEKEVKADDKNSKTIENLNQATLKSSIKLSHKYGVKVILLSVPETHEIYHQVFGPNLDSFNPEGKPHSKIDEVVSLLCNKGSNNGHSLIGGKFDPVLDGFVEGVHNEFEAQGGQPDLISTCKRVVLDQTGLDLSPCKSWTLLSTFLYNNKSDYFSPKASLEYSFIYIPHIWTMLSDSFDKKLMKTEPNMDDTTEMICPERDTDIHPEDSFAKLNPEPEIATSGSEQNLIQTLEEPTQASPEPVLEPTLNLDNLSDLRVVDLKAELDRRKVDYKGLPKKADLIALLQESIKLEQNQNPPEPVGTEDQMPKAQEGIESADLTDEKSAERLEEGEVAADASPDDSSINDAPEKDPNETVSAKRKVDDLDETEDNNSMDKKKVCTKAENTKEKHVELISESFVVRAKNEQQQSLSLVSLYDASQVGRSDQFELSIASNLLKESLVQHFSEYIMTVLVEDSRQKATSSSPSAHISTQSSNTSSLDTLSYTNNNSNGKLIFKNPSSTDQKVGQKELPVDRYVNIAFTFFDSAHTGYVYFDDLNKLFNNTGMTISKRALVSLLGESDKFNYRMLADLSPKLPATYVYQYPEQFRLLPGALLSGAMAPSSLKADNNKMVEYRGCSYDLEKLIEQVKETETLRVKLSERFNYAIDNFDKQAEEIHVLEVSQKSLAKAIKAQNDEICELKRERDATKKKYESIRKGIKGAITSLSDLVKEEK